MVSTPLIPDLAYVPPEKLIAIRQLEAELGDTFVIAFEPPLAPAKLTEEQVARVKRAEEELGMCLVAYKKTT